MSASWISIIFLAYGLAFFSMGLVVALEWGRQSSDDRLRRSLPPLAAFGILHGAHEWYELLQLNNLLPYQQSGEAAWEGLRLAILTMSFVSLAAFGAQLLAPNEKWRRLSLMLPVTLVIIWAVGILSLRSHYTIERGLLDTADVLTRYTLGIPGSALAAVGLVYQQRAFRRAGLARFGRDTLWAAAAYVWYGLVGQLFVRPSLLPPSTVVNQELFLDWFGFPVQMLRAAAAGAAAIFIIRSLRSFEVETQRQIQTLQKARLEEAQEREAVRGEMLRRIVAAQEAERQRVARELHDETGQALTAIGLGLRGVSTTLQQDTALATNNLRRLEKLVDHSLDELQRLIADLRPSHLDDLGLPAALRWWAGEVEKRADLVVQVSIHGPQRLLSLPVRIALFRITQEALNNILRHAAARTARVNLVFAADFVRLSVEDDGRGFDPQLIFHDNRRPSWGLLGIRERATLLGGEFSLQSRPGQGTYIEVVIPEQSGMVVEGEDEPEEEEVVDEYQPVAG